MSQAVSSPSSTSNMVPPPHAEVVTLTIDGVEVSVPKGTNILDAALKLHTEISYFCYHPGLSIAAACRQCLVAVEGMPKLVPSCQQTVAAGMKVDTQSGRVKTAQRQMLEFTLVNHPVDCPICDKAGECTLQKLYFEHDHMPSRVRVDKVEKPKKVDLGPTIVLDQERCILCSRCIRVCEEVAKNPQLTMAQRGDREVLTTAPGHKLDNPYSVNTVDVCPVGALTAKDFRFTMRAWELMTTPSVCNGCATGCNVEIHHREGRAYRLIPRENQDVNKFWMCDEGRLTYHGLHENRLTAPMVEGLPASWDGAVAEADRRLAPLIAGDKSKLGVVLSAIHTNEDNFALAKLARDLLGVGHVYLAGRRPVPERADDILRSADVNPNMAGAKAAAGAGAAGLSMLEDDLRSGALSGLIVLGADVPLSEDARAAAGALSALVVLSSHDTDLASIAHVLLPVAAWAEVSGTITNRQGRVQRMHPAFQPPGQAVPAWQAVVRLAKSLAPEQLDYPYPRAIFEEIKQRVPSFADASWGREAPLVQLRFANSRG